MVRSNGNTWKLALGSVGVVYGDIGTSPLYAMREGLRAAADEGLTEREVIGITSLLLWTIIVIVTFKYVILILRADNNGEGGTLSLLALAQSAVGRRTPWLLALGIIGTSLFFGDAMITPAISVLSAVEGLTLVTPGFGPYVLPVTVCIIVALFWAQSNGTERISALFGPITMVWFLTMAALGITHISDQFGIMQAFNPLEALGFLSNHGVAALPVMGSVFLAATGAEALYADMGHFGRRPIRLAWSLVVFPALALNYLGQGAFVLAQPEAASNPFFLMAPAWGLLPLVILATVATVIASQAVISGAFSLTHQAVQLGLLPRLEVRHTSESLMGQIYLPRVNWTLMAGVLFLVVTFGSSSALASAYGIAVTGDMVITSLLAAVVFRRVWGWSIWLVAAVVLPLLVIEGSFLAANLAKVLDGGYVPLIIAGIVGLLIWTWVRGTDIVQTKARSDSIPLDTLLASLAKSAPAAVPGTAVFLTANPEVAPPALMHNLKHNRVLHHSNLIVKVNVETAPRVSEAGRIEVRRIDDRFALVTLHFGYMEQPNVPMALALGRPRNLRTEIMSTSYFLNRRTFRAAPNRRMPFWQSRLYVSMAKAASDATDFYRIPSNRVLELGQQFTI